MAASSTFDGKHWFHFTVSKKRPITCVCTHRCHMQWLQQLALLDKQNRKVRGPARLHVNEADTNRNIKEIWIIQRGWKKQTDTVCLLFHVNRVEVKWKQGRFWTYDVRIAVIFVSCIVTCWNNRASRST